MRESVKLGRRKELEGNQEIIRKNRKLWMSRRIAGDKGNCGKAWRIVKEMENCRKMLNSGEEQRIVV